MSAAPFATAAMRRMTDRLARVSAALGTRIALDAETLLDRSDALPLGAPGRISPNGSCRILRAPDGWVAVNLPREEDRELVPAWTGAGFDEPAWPAVERAAARTPAATFVRDGSSLGLAVAVLGERTARSPRPRVIRPAGAQSCGPGRPLRVLDLSALWAGPLCGAILAAHGHDVTKVESPARPDPVATHTPALDRRLNGRKRRLSIPFPSPRMDSLLAEADVLITSARPRAFDMAGWSVERLFAARPSLIWVAITGHGWGGEDGARTGFGDDAAVAGGLVAWRGNEPAFAGDALADPLTGVAAGMAAIEAIASGGGVLIDAALAGTAAGVASWA